MFPELIWLAGLLLLYLAAHVYGSYKAILILNATIRVEKLAKSYGLDYNIRNKKSMYIICILFSWLAYFALTSMQVDPDEKGDDND